MKKILALLVVVSMLLPLGMIMPSAADVEGDWMTYRQANDYPEIDPETGEEPTYRAAPGYEYTDEGFTTIPADYTNTSPYFNVQTKEKQNIKDGLYLKFRVDDFSYKGPDGKSDEWIALSLWTKENLAPGNTDHGSGWICLLRDQVDSDEVEACSHITKESTEESKGMFKGYDDTFFVPEKDDLGREIYTLSIEYVNDVYNISVCGVLLANNDVVSKFLNQFDENGDFYVGVSFMSGVKDGKAAMTILEYGTSESTATKPLGSDRKEPEINNNIVADMMDASSIGENQPGLYWDASRYSPVGQNLEFAPLGNNAFKVTGLESGGLFNWTIPKDISYAVEDFPVFAMMVKDYWSKGTLWYYAGDIVSANHDYRITYNAFEGLYYEEEEFADYTLIYIDLTGMCSGRINGFRIDMSIDMAAPEFQICYMGCFRSVDEAAAYGNNYLGVDSTPADTTEVGGTTVNTEDNDPETNAPETNAPDAGVEETVADTKASETNGDGEKQTSEPTGDSGCSSLVGVSTVSIVVLAAAYLCKKKENF